MVLEAAAGMDGIEVVAAVESPGHPDAGQPLATHWGDLTLMTDPGSLTEDIDVAIDFSVPASAVPFTVAMAAKGIPVISGTTGVSRADIEAMREAAKAAPVLWASNTSLGVYCLHELSALARTLLGSAYDVEIVEVHHRHKRDAPSGTALSVAARIGGETLAMVAGREGECGPRKEDELGILAVRGGEVVGDHTIHFLGDYDRIEITHRASSRMAFAQGALLLARRIRGRAPGFLSVSDLLGSDRG
jgi:4-hydroxy-tetrahydrodipicolinate reductase